MKKGLAFLNAFILATALAFVLTGCSTNCHQRPQEFPLVRSVWLMTKTIKKYQLYLDIWQRRWLVCPKRTVSKWFEKN